MTVAVEHASALLGVYRPPDPVFVRGSGSFLEDADGNRYLDFTSGIGVNALGHGSEVVIGAVEASLRDGLVHTSNLFRTRPAEELAELLVRSSVPGKVFFANSGAEAVEAALKFTRLWARTIGGSDKHEVLAFRGGFHGRLFGSLAITDRPGYQAPFLPLMPGARFAHVGDLSQVARLATRASTAAVIIEPVQGEGGVHPIDATFLRALRTLCTERDIALVFDEVQCGLGRTGTLFAYQQAGVEPDVLTLAKPLAGGLPMGSVVLSHRLADCVGPADHATTFGGGPLVSRVALEVLRTVGAPDFLARVRQLGQLIEAWGSTVIRRPGVRAVRGKGLMWGIELTTPAADVMNGAREEGLLVLGAGPHVIRLLPPLNIPENALKSGLEILTRVIP